MGKGDSGGKGGTDEGVGTIGGLTTSVTDPSEEGPRHTNVNG